MAQIIATTLRAAPGLPRTPHQLIHRPCLSTTDEGVNTLGAHYYPQFSQNGKISNNIESNNSSQNSNINHDSSIEGLGSPDEGYFSELLFSPPSDFDTTTPSSSPSTCSSSQENELLFGDVSPGPIFFIGSPQEYESTLTSNCSLLEDLDSTLNETVERNLEAHLLATSGSSNDLELPQIDLFTGDQDILQFELELPDVIEIHGAAQSSALSFYPVSQTSHELLPSPEKFFSAPSVTSEFSPFEETVESPLTDESSVGVPGDSPLFFIPEEVNNDFLMAEELNEEAFEVGEQSEGSSDGYNADQSLQSASPSTLSPESSFSFGSPVCNTSVIHNLSSPPSVSSFRLIRICPSVTSPNSAQQGAMVTPQNRRFPTVTSPSVEIVTSPSVETVTSLNRPTVTSPSLSTMTSSDEEASCSNSVPAMPRYLQIVRDPCKKKSQNREASQRYRKKKKTEVASLEHTVAELRQRKKELMDRIEGKRKEANVLKNLLFEMDV